MPSRRVRTPAATSTRPSTVSPRSPSLPRRSRPKCSAPARPPMRAPEDLRTLVEEGLDELSFHPSLAGLAEPMRYALAGGGKRIRPVICLATTDAAGGRVEDALPSMDDDDERRGRPSLHVAYADGVALLAGDALLAEGLRLAARQERPEPAREL